MSLRSRIVALLWWVAALGGCSPFSGYHAASEKSGDAAMASDGGSDAGQHDDAGKKHDERDAAADGGKNDGAAMAAEQDCATRGKGTSAQPCLVHDCSELQDVAAHPTGVYALANDIDCKKHDAPDGKGFAPIGSASKPFTGKLLGHGHLIESLRIGRSDENELGLVGVARGAELSDFGVIDADISAHDYSAVIVGSAQDGTKVARVFASGNVTARTFTGGLVGELSGSSLSDSYTLVSVNGSPGDDPNTPLPGLLVGRISHAAQVTRCYVQATNDWVLNPMIGDQADSDSHVQASFFDCSVEGGVCRSYVEEETPGTLFAVPELFMLAGWDYQTPVWGVRSDGARPCLRWEAGCKSYPMKGYEMAGSGTDDAPYQVTSCKQLQAVALAPAAIYALQNDIDCSGFDFGDGYGFFPLGSLNQQFRGELRGGGHVVSGLRMMRRDRSSVGLFSALGEGAKIEGLHLDDVVILGDRDVGALAGTVNKASVDGCTANGVIAMRATGSSPLIGDLVQGMITNTSDTLAVSALP